MSDKGRRITFKQLAIDQYKREYERRDLADEKLKKIKDHLQSYTPDSAAKARENELRVIAINEILHND